MNIDIEDWLRTNNFDVEDQDIDWDDLEEYADEMAQQAIEDSMDWIAQEVIIKFKLKKRTGVE